MTSNLESIDKSGNKLGSTFKATLLISGTAIGGGMLALPIVTAGAGLLPTLFIFIATWIVMSSTGVLIYENSIGLKSDSNLISLASYAFGKAGRVVTWILYLFLFYSLMTAYLSGLSSFLAPMLPTALSPWASLLSCLLFAPFLFLGVRFSSTVNVFMMVALFASFGLFLVLGMPLVQPELLTHTNWSLMFVALPIIFTSFSFQGTVPTIVHYLHHDGQKIKKAIWIGTAIPLVLYILFEILVLGIVPLEGANSLQEALLLQTNAVTPLQYWIEYPFLLLLGRIFSFFALFTSFIGVGIGLFDFLADGLKIEKRSMGKLLLSLLVLVPPLLITAYNPHLFLTALEYAGGIGCALLLGVMPILIALKRRKSGHKKVLPGGKVFLYSLMAFLLIEIGTEVFSKVSSLIGELL